VVRLRRDNGSGPGCCGDRRAARLSIRSEQVLDTGSLSGVASRTTP
jgi:hypothetical protein